MLSTVKTMANSVRQILAGTRNAGARFTTVRATDGGLSPTIPPQQPAAASADELRTPMIMPSYWSGELPLEPKEFTIDAQAYGDLSAGPTPDLAARMEETFDATGLVLLTNTGLGDDVPAMKRLTTPVIKDVMVYEGGANSREEVAVNVFDTGAPMQAHLHYHLEMAYVSRSTSMLGFVCSASINDGLRGATFVSDVQQATTAIMQTDLGHKLKDLGITYIRCLTDRESGMDDDPTNDESGVYNHWQTSFGVETPEAAEEAARAAGLDVEWSGRFMKTRFTTSGFEYFPQLDRNLLYSSVADDSMWFDTWPGVRHLPTLQAWQSVSPADRPLKITFGDGSDFSREELQQFVEVYDKFGLPVVWRKGDVLVVCNHRWAHGRPAYNLGPGEARELGVILGPKYDRLGQVAGKF